MQEVFLMLQILFTSQQSVVHYKEKKNGILKGLLLAFKKTL